MNIIMFVNYTDNRNDVKSQKVSIVINRLDQIIKKVIIIYKSRLTDHCISSTLFCFD